MSMQVHKLWNIIVFKVMFIPWEAWHSFSPLPGPSRERLKYNRNCHSVPHFAMLITSILLPYLTIFSPFFSLLNMSHFSFPECFSFSMSPLSARPRSSFQGLEVYSWCCSSGVGESLRCRLFPSTGACCSRRSQASLQMKLVPLQWSHPGCWI